MEVLQDLPAFLVASSTCGQRITPHTMDFSNEDDEDNMFFMQGNISNDSNSSDGEGDESNESGSVKVVHVERVWDASQ